MDVTDDMQLYASHEHIVRKAEKLAPQLPACVFCTELDARAQKL